MPLYPVTLAYRSTIIGSCAVVLVIILVAGLWPFHSPTNDVGWLANENGIWIGNHGCLLSSGTLGNQDFADARSGSVELWIKPDRVAKGRRTILAFEGPGDDSTTLSIQQDGSTLIVQRKNAEENGTLHTAESSVAGVLSSDDRVGLTVALGPHDTTIYRNGLLAGIFHISGLSTPSFGGRFVLGSAMNVGGNWRGRVYGLAMYGRKLLPKEVASHYEEWVKSGRPIATYQELPIVSYLFTERAGSIIHEQFGSQNNLLIPARYVVLHPEFLSLPSRHFRSTLAYWEDVAINIIGFVPFGFSFFALFSMVRETKHSAFLVIFLGFLTSLSIEVLQAWLPTRNSGVNDLITNTLGSGLGVLFFRYPFTRLVLSKERSGG
jgi:VanZ family protein